VFDVAEAAGQLGISRSKLYRLISEGKFPHRKLDGQIKVTDADIEEYLADSYRPVVA
jgi:excisionase family DNA binding protein